MLQTRRIPMEGDTDDYTLGEEVTSQVKVKKPTGIVVSTRLEPEIADELMAISEATGKRLSQVVREAILAYIEHPSGQREIVGTHIGMGTIGGSVSAMFTIRNTVVTNSGLTDHSERLVRAR
jgi:hypothetical protein